ncbi:MAG: cupin domain-containing protein [Arenicellales bacterium]|nr:cupin domain-containing protein [Arenicellales bacterium]HJO18192.1 cupin domain-containing protein [Vicinamibacterales bacterium]
MTRRQRTYAVVACLVCFGAGMFAQTATDIVSYQSGPNGTRLDVLFDGPAMGAEVDVGRMTFPPGTNSGDHSHGVTEIFYILEGTLEHVVNGESNILTEGMLGYVKPPDVVSHIVDTDGPPTKALVIWVPGGEAARIGTRWQRIP